jgi:Zn-dependent M28 family amino/carboxypeptidase
VVVTAHYDHLPPGRPVNGDSIYNGFLDNAIGVATVLGVAESLRRTPLSADVVFVLTTAEEEGSLGSAFYATHLPHSRDRFIANVNVDAAAPLAPPRGWIIEGGGEPVIARAAARVAAATGWTITPAPLQQNSDHWSFHRIGVPAAFAVPDSGWEGVTPAEEEALVGQWWRVHHPDDEWRPDFPIAGFARQIELVTRLVRELASDSR